jgi:hypothetical protein
VGGVRLRVKEMALEAAWFRSIASQAWRQVFSTTRYCETETYSNIGTVIEGKIKHKEAAVVKDLGSIVVKCIHKMCRMGKDKKPRSQVEGVGIISEKALKGRGISHSVE